METQVKKEELYLQLLPFIYKDITVFATALIDGQQGIFGVNNNTVVFIESKNLEDTLNITLPSSLEEINNLLITGEWLLQRTMMTPDIQCQGAEERAFLLPSIIIKTIHHFVKNYDKNVKRMEANFE